MKKRVTLACLYAYLRYCLSLNPKKRSLPKYKWLRCFSYHFSCFMPQYSMSFSFGIEGSEEEIKGTTEDHYRALKQSVGLQKVRG